MWLHAIKSSTGKSWGLRSATSEPLPQSKVLTKQSFAKLYRMSEEDVSVFAYDAACAIKISIPRPYIQGDPDDGDMYGGQQHGPLVNLLVPS
jgi:hypothetical protein